MLDAGEVDGRMTNVTMFAISGIGKVPKQYYTLLAATT